jgi:hypothetical protein
MVMLKIQNINIVNNVFYKNIEFRNITIKLNDGSKLKGKINLLAESPQEYGLVDKNDPNMGQYYCRVSDLFTLGRNPFIVVFDAVADWNESKVFIINKANILWAIPDE